MLLLGRKRELGLHGESPLFLAVVVVVVIVVFVVLLSPFLLLWVR